MSFSEALRIESSMADHFCVFPENDVLENEADNDFAYEEYLEAEDEDSNGDSCWRCRVDLADRSQQLRFSYAVLFLNFLLELLWCEMRTLSFSTS